MPFVSKNCFQCYTIFIIDTNSVVDVYGLLVYFMLKCFNIFKVCYFFFFLFYKNPNEPKRNVVEFILKCNVKICYSLYYHNIQQTKQKTIKQKKFNNSCTVFWKLQIMNSYFSIIWHIYCHNVYSIENRAFQYTILLCCSVPSICTILIIHTSILQKINSVNKTGTGSRNWWPAFIWEGLK